MRQVDEQPKSGSYLAVWEYGGKLWADTYMWNDNELLIYGSDKECPDDFVSYEGQSEGIENVKYFVI